MALGRKITLLSFLTATICFAVVLHQVKGQNISITRGEPDVFTNVARDCGQMEATCFDENCTYCQCAKAKATFVRTRGRYGKCIPNEYFMYLTSYNSSFLVEDIFQQYCLQPEESSSQSHRYVKVIRPCNTRSRRERWLWTNHRQLVNLDVIRCITVYSNYYYVTLDKCDAQNKWQSWKCERNNPYYVRNEKTNKYLQYSGIILGRGNGGRFFQWKRYGSNETLCSKAVGCEKFRDGSSILTLNETSKCEDKCLGEKEINLTKNVTECSLVLNQTQYFHKDGEWKPLLVNEESLDVFTKNNRAFLKWNLDKTPRSWGGLIVQVKFTCNNSVQDESKNDVGCVLIKYSGIFIGFDVSNGNDKQGGEDERSQTTVIVVVCVLVIAFIVGVVAFFAYRNKSSLANYLTRRKADKDKPRNVNRGPKAGNSTNPIYHTEADRAAQSNCQLYESTPEPVYQMANAGQETEAQQQPNLTYDYALPEDQSRIALRNGEKNGSSNSAPAPPIYHVLEK